MKIEMDAAAAAVDNLEVALESYRGSAAQWDSASEYEHKEPGLGDQGLMLAHVEPLPSAFVAQAASFQYKSFMGLFPEIGRAWLTADTKLFLWSYGEERVLCGNPTSDDFCSFEGLDQVIVAVALVKPQPDVFVDDVQYVLVIATTVEVTLLAVTFPGNGVAGELCLTPTGISVPTNGVLITKAIGTADGRIFMAGGDGNLHEFVYYSKQRSWKDALWGTSHAKRPKKVTHKSASLVQYVLPSLMSDYFTKTDELLDIAVDESRKLLYTLSLSGKLTAYDTSVSETARLIKSVSILAESRSMLSYSLPDKEREYIAVFPVSQHQSKLVHCVVVTSFGERIYFSTSARSGRAQSAPLLHETDALARGASFTGRLSGTKRSQPEPHSSGPTTLRCISARGTPTLDNTPPGYKPCYHMALWAPGAVLLSDLRMGLDDRLVSVFPESSRGRGTNARGSSGRGSLDDGVGVGSRGVVRPPGRGLPVESVHQLILSKAIGVPKSHGTRTEPFTYRGEHTTPQRSGSSPGRGNSGLLHTYAVVPAGTAVRRGATVRASFASLGTSDLGSGPARVLEAPKLFWVLTSSALLLYKRQEPRDILSEILSTSVAGGEDYELELFFRHYGHAQASAHCIDLALTTPSLATNAAQALYSIGGHTHVPDGSRDGHGGGQDGDGHGDEGGGSGGRTSVFGSRRYVRGSRSTFDVGRPSLRHSSNMSLSGVHDGFGVCVANTLRDIWDEFLCSSRDPAAYQSLAMSTQMINQKRDRLCGLVSFLNHFDPEAMLPWDDDDGGAGGGVGSGHGGDRDGRDPRQHRSSTPATPRGYGLYGRTSIGGSQDRHDSRSIRARVRRTSEARRAEVTALQNMKHLASRCSETLGLLGILAEHQVHRIVPALQLEVRNEFVNMSFSDLVARVPGMAVSTALIEVMYHDFASTGTDLGPLTKLLKSRCHSYFDDDALTLQRGLQNIRDAVERLGSSDRGVEAASTLPGLPQEMAMSGSNASEAIELAENAVETLKPLAGRIFDPATVCLHVAQVGAIAGAVELGLAVGDAAESDDPERATSAYGCVLDLLEPLVMDADVRAIRTEAGLSSNVDVVMNPRRDDGANGLRKDAAIRVAFNARSERFRDMLYNFLSQSAAGEAELLGHVSKGVEAFLRAPGRQNLLWKYFARHGRYCEAAGILVEMAEDETQEGNVLDRLSLLSRALHNAQAAVASGDSSASALQSDVRDFMDVVEMQLRLRDEFVKRHGDSEAADTVLPALDSRILDFTVLYNEYALPYELLESSLDILRCGSYRDDSTVRKVWTKLVDEELAMNQTPALLQKRIVALGKRLAQSELVFPVKFIVELLERRTYEHAERAGWENAHGWVSQAMIDVGVSLGEIVDAYRRLIEAGGYSGREVDGRSSWSWNEEGAQMHAIRSVASVLAVWAERCRSAGSGISSADVERRVLVAEAEKALRVAALSKARLRGIGSRDAKEVVQHLEETEKIIEASK